MVLSSIHAVAYGGITLLCSFSSSFSSETERYMDPSKWSGASGAMPSAISPSAALLLRTVGLSDWVTSFKAVGGGNIWIGQGTSPASVRVLDSRSVFFSIYSADPVVRTSTPELLNAIILILPHQNEGGIKGIADSKQHSNPILRDNPSPTWP